MYIVSAVTSCVYFIMYSTGTTGLPRLKIRNKVSSTDGVGSEEVLHTVKQEMNILHTIKRRKANWIGHILRRNCILKHVMEGKAEE